jgi:hypothetical protein
MRIMFVMLGEMRPSSEFMARSLVLNIESPLDSLSAAGRVGHGRVSRLVRCLPPVVNASFKAGQAHRLAFHHRQLIREIQMPIILWLLGVPLTVVILLMLFHVI